MKTFGNYILYGVYFILLLGVAGKLFFEPQFDSVWNRARSVLHFSSRSTESITIAYSDPLIALNPLANDASSRVRLLHIYEPLVRRNPDLQIEPALALSYGALDDLTWEFKLRSGVMFHDGTPLAIEDVLYSLQQGRENPASEVRDFGSTIEKIQKMDETNLHIKTLEPDPLLPQKLSAFLIFPEHIKGKEVIGTGPYMLATNDDRGTLTLNRFENYWGTAPAVKTATLKTLETRDERIAALKNSSVDIVANVPQDSAKNFDFAGFELKTIPSLEVNFLMFNVSKIFKPLALRQAVRLTLDSSELAKLTQGFAVPVNQFVGQGIFGYDPTISTPELDPKKAEELVKNASGFFRVQTTLDLPKGLESLGLNVKEKLRAIGIDVALNFLSPSELGKKITSRESEFFFFGWSSELGDAADFLSAVVHSPSGSYGQYNGANYRNKSVDQVIEFGQQTIKADKRLERLREVMHTITVDDVIGIPLFSPETLFGVSDGIQWIPRVDGYVLAQEVK